MNYKFFFYFYNLNVAILMGFENTAISHIAKLISLTYTNRATMHIEIERSRYVKSLDLA